MIQSRYDHRNRIGRQGSRTWTGPQPQTRAAEIALARDLGEDQEGFWPVQGISYNKSVHSDHDWCLVSEQQLEKILKINSDLRLALSTHRPQQVNMLPFSLQKIKF